jgi:hypothetical protein
LSQATEVEGSPLSSDRNDEITVEMMQEMDYSADRAWYDLVLSYKLWIAMFTVLPSICSLM